MSQPPEGPYGDSSRGQGPYGDRPHRPDPDQMETRGARANAVLRLGGLVVIVLAFLGVSQSFTQDKKPGVRPAPTSTTPSRPAVVYADAELESVLRTIDPDATYTFGAGPQLEQALADGAAADVFLSTSKPAMRALVADKRCTTPVAFAIKPLYSSCQVIGKESDATAASAYVDSLTTLSARTALIDAGIDVPVTR